MAQGPHQHDPADPPTPGSPAPGSPQRGEAEAASAAPGSGSHAPGSGPAGEWVARRSALLEGLLGAISEAVVLTAPRLDRPEPMILYANAAFARLAGINAAALTGRPLEVLVPAGGKIDGLETMVANLLEAREQAGQMLLRRADGTTRRLNWRTSTLRPDTGWPGYGVAHLRDVTEQQNAAMQAAHARAVAETIAAHVPELVYLLAPDGHVELPAGQSHKAMRPLGEPTEVMPPLRQCVHPHDREVYDSEVARVATLAPGGVTECELRIFNGPIQEDGAEDPRGETDRAPQAGGADEAAGGETSDVMGGWSRQPSPYRSLRYRHEALTAPEALHGWVLGLVMDVTTQRLAERQFRRAQRIASLGVLASAIAHEMNDPLSSILAGAGLAQSMLEGPGAAEHVRPLLNQIGEDARRCGRIVAGLAAFSRSSALRDEQVRVSEVAMSVLHLTRSFAEAHSGRIYIDCPTHLPPVRANPLELQQAMVHLICRALEAGAAEVWVRAEVDSHTSRIAVHVEDDGPAISAETLEQARRSAITEDPHVQALSVVAGIVEDHGSGLQIRRIEDRHTLVRFDLAPAPA